MKKKEIIIVALVLLCGLVYLLVQKSGKINYTFPTIEKISEEEIGLITYTKDGTTISLKKENENWLINSEKFIANKTMIDKMTEFLSEVTFVDLISEQEIYEPYELDDGHSMILHVSWENNKAQFIFGKNTLSGNLSYMRIPKNKNVYSVLGKASNIFPQDIMSLRDKNVLKFEKSQVFELMITKDGRVYKLNLTDDKWLLDGEDFEKSTDFDNLLNTMSNLNCSEFLGVNNKNEAYLNIQITGEINKSLYLYEKTEKGYIAGSTESNEAFLIPNYIGSQIEALF